MRLIFVVDQPRDWPLDLDGVELVSGRDYISDRGWVDVRRARVFNLCRSYAYQSVGYYVSLLAEARGHRPLPSLATILETRSRHLARSLTGELDALIQRSLRDIQSEQFTLSIYFGRNLAKRHASLAARLFEVAEAPLLRAQFNHRERWELTSLRLISADDIPAEHHEFAVTAAEAFLQKRRPATRRRSKGLYDLAILVDPKEPDPPSNARALRQFESAARRAGFESELITRADLNRLLEFDALFIRATTAVNHYTYTFAQRAAAEGLVVMDDPTSILRCTNKVYLAEMLQRQRISHPQTVILHRRNWEQAAQTLKFPCVLKAPDSAFSRGVHKVSNAEELRVRVRELLEESELIIAQGFLPTEFDWRIGLLDGQPLYACRYWMAAQHWQIVHHQSGGHKTEGEADTLAIADTPTEVLQIARKAAAAMGDGLYGVDIKEAQGKYYVIEVNDNPSIDAGTEDAVLKEALYDRIMQSFRTRLDNLKGNHV